MGRQSIHSKFPKFWFDPVTRKVWPMQQYQVSSNVYVNFGNFEVWSGYVNSNAPTHPGHISSDERFVRNVHTELLQDKDFTSRLIEIDLYAFQLPNEFGEVIARFICAHEDGVTKSEEQTHILTKKEILEKSDYIKSVIGSSAKAVSETYSSSFVMNSIYHSTSSSTLASPEFRLIESMIPDADVVNSFIKSTHVRRVNSIGSMCNIYFSKNYRKLTRYYEIKKKDPASTKITVNDEEYWFKESVLIENSVGVDLQLSSYKDISESKFGSRKINIGDKVVIKLINDYNGCMLVGYKKKLCMPNHYFVFFLKKTDDMTIDEVESLRSSIVSSMQTDSFKEWSPKIDMDLSERLYKHIGSRNISMNAGNEIKNALEWLKVEV